MLRYLLVLSENMKTSIYLTSNIKYIDKNQENGRRLQNEYNVYHSKTQEAYVTIYYTIILIHFESKLLTHVI